MTPDVSDSLQVDTQWDRQKESHGSRLSADDNDGVRARPLSGTAALVRAGPFRGLRGVLEDTGHPTRLILNTRVLGRPVSVEIDASLLETRRPSGVATAAWATRRTRKQVAAIIKRRAALAGMADAVYFREIIDGRAPRITRAEAALEMVR
jgi:hypothetical protein